MREKAGMITEEMISPKAPEIDLGPTTGREKDPKTETEDETPETDLETDPGREGETGTGTGRGREETDPVTDAAVDHETKITGDPRKIAEEADLKNGNLRSITGDHLPVTSSGYSCDQLSILFCT